MSDASITKSSTGPLVCGGFYSPPFMWYEKAKLTGPLIDLVRHLADAHHLAISVRAVTLQEMLEPATVGVALGVGVFHTAARESLGEFTRPFTQIPLQGLGFKAFDAPDVDTLLRSDARLAVKKGDVGWDTLVADYGIDMITERCFVIPTEAMENTWDSLAARECDVALADALTLSGIRTTIDAPTAFSFARPPAMIPIALCVHASCPLGRDEIDQWFATSAGTAALARLTACVGTDLDAMIECAQSAPHDVRHPGVWSTHRR